MKYGNSGFNCPSVDIPTKYAYVPWGNSGVLQYLPLFTSRSPELLNL